MRIDGSQIQNAIYIAGETQWPVGADAWEARAQEVLDPGPFGYIAGGAGRESTMRANLEAFERRRLRPRMLRGTRERDITVDVLGTRSSAPLRLRRTRTSRVWSGRFAMQVRAKPSRRSPKHPTKAHRP